MANDVRLRALQRALEIVGARSVLCARLGMRDTQLDEWLVEGAPVPDDAFELAVQIVLDDDIVRASADRRAEPRTGPFVDPIV